MKLMAFDMLDNTTYIGKTTGRWEADEFGHITMALTNYVVGRTSEIITSAFDSSYGEVTIDLYESQKETEDLTHIYSQNLKASHTLVDLLEE